jgi:hypothetical protein
MLFFLDGGAFATSYSTYAYLPATEQEVSPRIFLQVSIEGIYTEAFLDTGAPYVVCKPQVAEVLGLDPEKGEWIKDFRIRNDKLAGRLVRLTITILAEEGLPLPVDATVFVPDLDPHQEWGEFPSILGLTGFLERIRFAIDPSENRFYFGALA